MPSSPFTSDPAPTAPFDSGAISSYDYDLPPELIASVPLAARDASRLLVVNRAERSITHATFRDLPSYLREDDLLVVNETRVVPAKLRGVRAATGGKWEGLFLGIEGTTLWRLIGQTRGKLRPGEELSLSPADSPDSPERLRLILREQRGDGEWLVEPVPSVAGLSESGGSTSAKQKPAHPPKESGSLDHGDLESSAPLGHTSTGFGESGDFERPVAEPQATPTDPWQLLDQFGTVPLPPYIERTAASPEDRERYQTTYARNPGAIAAPTAGLHFTPEVFEACRSRGVEVAPLTLHVGIGTFRPVTTQRLDDHVMHFEYGELPAPTVEAIHRTRQRGGRVIAVGTTAVRTLESVAHSGPLRAWSGETNLFIRPPYEFQVVNALVTNFHLPKSTLLVLVSALAGRDLILEAYRQAIAERYRFFSYGDAMLIV